jgi:phenylalanyl-tRNA synthetase beta chain
MQITGFFFYYPNRLTRSKIDVSLEWLEKRLGKLIPNNEMAKKLERLGFDVKFDGNNMRVVAPTWRSTGDVSIPDDIMEEVARMYGFENFEPTPITTTFTGAINQLEVDLDRRIKEYFAFRCGMREIFTYPWMNDEYVAAILHSDKDLLSLSTPPSPHEHYIRSSHLPNLCKAVAGNLRFFSEFALFESAQVFFKRDFTSQYGAREALPFQRKNVAGAFVGNPEMINSLFRKTKGIIEALPSFVHIEPITFERTDKPIWADDVLWLNIGFGGVRIGNLALLSKKASLDCGIKNSAVMLFELDIDSLKPLPSRTNKFTHLPEYPMTDYDISLLFDLSDKWDKIFEVITSKGITGKGSSDDLLRAVSFVDEYRGRQVPEGKKSVTIRLVIGSLKKTLTSDEIENCANTVIKRLNKSFGAELRS